MSLSLTERNHSYGSLNKTLRLTSAFAPVCHRAPLTTECFCMWRWVSLNLQRFNIPSPFLFMFGALFHFSQVDGELLSSLATLLGTSGPSSMQLRIS